MKDNKLVYIKKPYLVWEILIADTITFYLSMPDEWEPFITHELNVCWEKITLQNSDYVFTPDHPVTIGTISLVNHCFLSLSTDKRTLDPLPAILENHSLLSPGEKILIQIILDPAPYDWYDGVQDAYKRFRSGQMPQRFEITPKRIIQALAKTGAAVGVEIMTTVGEIITEKEVKTDIQVEEPERINLARNGLSYATQRKAQGNAFDTTIRAISCSPDAQKRNVLLQGVLTAFNTIQGDNYFALNTSFNSDKHLAEVQARTAPAFKLNHDYLNTAETAKLLQLPPLSLQTEYPIQSIGHRELEIPVYLTQKGIPIGDVTHKGEKHNVSWPVHNYDELCLPRVVLGGMGTGKTVFAAGFGTDALRAGYSIFAIEAADGDFPNMIRDSLPADFPEDHIIDLDFGNLEYPIYLNWEEVSRKTGGRREIANSISSHLVSYLSKFTTEAGDRTERYLRAAGKSVFMTDPNATILEIFLILCSEEYRHQVVSKLTDIRLIELWQDFDQMSPGLRSQIVAPILNRMDGLMNNEYVANCLMQKPKGGRIDFRKWADGDDRGPYCVLLRAPKSILMEEGTDALVTWIISKLWLSILTRIDQPITLRKPCFLLLDEPSQYFGSGRGGVRSTWASMITESRKWRLGLVFMFHEWAQLGRELGNLIKSAGAHYVLYSSSKETFQSLAEEIDPFTVEEALNIPTHSALCIVRSEKQNHKFLAKMKFPPVLSGKDGRYKYVNRQHITSNCSRTYGQHYDEVELDIYQREKVLFRKK